MSGPGFINIDLRPEFLGAQLQSMLGDARLGVPPVAVPQTVVIDYSAPNVAKEMHVGHLRSTVIGDALARTLEALDHRVIRQNHVGDWGTQFGMLIEHLAENGDAGGAGAAGGFALKDMNEFYRLAQERFQADPEFAARARRRVVELQSGEPLARDLWSQLVSESEHHFAEVYARLDVTLDDQHYRPESSYNEFLAGVADELEKKGVAVISEGALCVFVEGFHGRDGRPTPLIVRKSDGGFGYAATDLAALRYRLLELRADRLVYVTDSRQTQHFAMLFATARSAGWVRDGVRLEHVIFGSVLGEDGKPLRTRAGETVRLVELLDEAERRAHAIVDEKSPGLTDSERDRIAHVVGVGAVKYADLVTERHHDYVFSWSRMLSLDGNTAPYLQYAYARVRSILRKAAAEDGSVEEADWKDTAVAEAPSPEQVALESAEREVVLRLLQFPDAVGAVSDTLEPHRLCAYLYELATSFSVFYEQCPVLRAEAATRRWRLRLCQLTALTLERGLNLLGIDVLERV